MGATEEAKEEIKEEKKEEAKEEDEEDLGTEPPKVELTDEERKTNFLKPKIKDLYDKALSSSFGQFSIPEKSEGFEDITFEWQNAQKSKAYLDTWRLEKKISSKIDGLQPGEWFKTTLAEFQKTVSEYQAKQSDFKKKP